MSRLDDWQGWLKMVSTISSLSADGAAFIRQARPLSPVSSYRNADTMSTVILWSDGAEEAIADIDRPA